MANVYELVLGGTNGGGNFFENVWHYLLDEAGASNAFEYAQHLITAWQAAAQNKWRDCIGSDCQLNLIHAKRRTGGGGLSAVGAVNLAGTGAGQSVSNGLCADIAWVSQSPINRPGHTFVPAVPEGMLFQDGWDPSYVASLDTFAQEMETPLTLTGGLGTATFTLYHTGPGTNHLIIAHDIRSKPTYLGRRILPVI